VPAFGARTLLVNPPLVRGIAFTRQGRCQEREDVFGTIKPPYSLALCAALLRARGHDVRLADLTASRQSADALATSLEREGFRPTLIVFASTTPTFDADVAALAPLKARWGAPIFSFGPHASATPHECMQRAPEIDGVLVGEPEDTLVALAETDDRHPESIATIPALMSRRGGLLTAHRAHGIFAGFDVAQRPDPAWDLLDLSAYQLPLLNQQTVIVETGRGCPYACDFCVAPLHQGHKFRERSATDLVDEIERIHRRYGVSCFYLWGDTVTLNASTFGAFCAELIARRLPIRWLSNARADNLVDAAFVDRLRASGCWMLALGIESGSDATRSAMQKRLSDQAIRAAFSNLRRAGIRSFGFFILGHPGETPATLEQTVEYAVALDPDYANFYPAVPYPGTALHAKARRDGWLVDDDWSRMEYSHYLLNGNGLNERVVLDAVRRAARRFYLRPSYLVRHLADAARLGLMDTRRAWRIARRLFVGVRERPTPTVRSTADQRAA
jgi:radical SAM superfamily enzyme YgiQ (UPF0313 family)